MTKSKTSKASVEEPPADLADEDGGFSGREDSSDRVAHFHRGGADPDGPACDPARFKGMYANNDFWHFVDDYLVYVHKTCENESLSQAEFDDRYNS